MKNVTLLRSQGIWQRGLQTALNRFRIHQQTSKAPTLSPHSGQKNFILTQYMKVAHSLRSSSHDTSRNMHRNKEKLTEVIQLIQVDSLQTIALFQPGCNYAFTYLGHEMTKNSERHSTIAAEQFGSHKQPCAIDQATTTKL
jgi:hypothetical protein